MVFLYREHIYKRKMRYFGGVCYKWFDNLIFKKNRHGTKSPGEKSGLEIHLGLTANIEVFEM